MQEVRVEAYESLGDSSRTLVWEEQISGNRASYLYHCDFLNELTTTVHRCLPNTTYFFSVRAQNEVDWGEWSEWAELATTRPVAAVRPTPPRLQPYNAPSMYNRTQLAIVWSQPENYGLPIDRYEVMSA